MSENELLNSQNRWSDEKYSDFVLQSAKHHISIAQQISELKLLDEGLTKHEKECTTALHKELVMEKKQYEAGL